MLGFCDLKNVVKVKNNRFSKGCFKIITIMETTEELSPSTKEVPSAKVPFPPPRLPPQIPPGPPVTPVTTIPAPTCSYYTLAAVIVAYFLGIYLFLKMFIIKEESSSASNA